MLIGIFKSGQKVMNGFAILLLLLLWFTSFFTTVEISIPSITGVSWLDFLLAILLIAIQSVYLNFIVSEFKLVSVSSYLTSLFFIIFNSCFVWMLQFNDVVIANTFLLLAFHQLLRTYSAKKDYMIFNAAFFIGIAGLIYSPLLVFFPLLWIVLLYIGSPSWRGFFIAFIGFCLPFVYFFSYHFIGGNLSVIDIDNYLVNIFNLNLEVFSFVNVLFLVVLLLVSIFAIFNFFVEIGKSVVKIGQMLVVVLLLLFFGVSTIFLNHFDYLAMLIVVSIPLSIMFAIFFQRIKRAWLAEFIFSIMLLSIIAGYFS